jgi:hypothetical protein
MRSPGLLRVLAPVLLAGAIGCSSHRAVTIKGPEDLVWPADNPRIRLQSLVDLQNTKSGGAARVVSWLGGEKQIPIFQRPYAVAWDGEDLLVTDPDIGRVARIARRGRITLSPEGLFVHPIGIAACPQGIVVTDSGAGKLALLDRELEHVRWLWEDLSRPTGVGCDGERIFLVETAAHRIRVLGPDGEQRKLGGRGPEPGEFNFPAPIAVHGGDLLVGDTLNFRIQRVDPASGRSLQMFGQLGDAAGETPRIKGVAVDAAGRIWVTDAILDQLSLYDEDGRFLLSIGGTGLEPGQFSFPAGIAAHPDGRVVVADSLNRRLQVFDLLEPGASRAR